MLFYHFFMPLPYQYHFVPSSRALFLRIFVMLHGHFVLFFLSAHDLKCYRRGRNLKYSIANH